MAAPCSKPWHQIDLIVTKREHLKNVLHTRVFQSADCDTDHSLVCCKFRVPSKKVHRQKKPVKFCIDTDIALEVASEKATNFCAELEAKLQTWKNHSKSSGIK